MVSEKETWPVMPFFRAWGGYFAGTLRVAVGGSSTVSLVMTKERVDSAPNSWEPSEAPIAEICPGPPKLTDDRDEPNRGGGVRGLAAIFFGLRRFGFARRFLGLGFGAATFTTVVCFLVSFLGGWV